MANKNCIQKILLLPLDRFFFNKSFVLSVDVDYVSSKWALAFEKCDLIRLKLENGNFKIKIIC